MKEWTFLILVGLLATADRSDVYLLIVVAMYVCFIVGVWIVDCWMERNGVIWHYDETAPHPFESKVQTVVKENVKKVATENSDRP